MDAARQDGDYLLRLARRMQTLERRSHGMQRALLAGAGEMRRSRLDLSSELSALHTELSALEREASQTARRIESAIARFRHVVKRGELKRLAQRIDAWAPERNLSRPQFKRMCS